MLWVIVALLCLALGAMGRILTVGRTLARLRTDLEEAQRQLLLYRSMEPICRDTPNARRNREQIELSQTIYHGVAEAYNRYLRKPGSRLTARLLDYHPVEEEGGARHAHRRL